MAQLLFWLCVLPSRRSFDPLPKVSMVVSAYNEAECIGEKVSNSLALDYPPDRFQCPEGDHRRLPAGVSAPSSDRGGQLPVLAMVSFAPIPRRGSPRVCALVA